MGKHEEQNSRHKDTEDIYYDRGFGYIKSWGWERGHKKKTSEGESASKKSDQLNSKENEEENSAKNDNQEEEKKSENEDYEQSDYEQNDRKDLAKKELGPQIHDTRQRAYHD